MSKVRYPTAIIFSVLGHIALFSGLLMSSDQWRTDIEEPAGASPPINATIVDQAKVQQQIEKLKQLEKDKRAKEQARLDELDNTRKEKELALEKLKTEKEEIAKQKEFEQARLEKAKKEAQEQEKKAEEAKKKAEVDKKRKAEEAKKKIEAEKKRKADEVKKKAEAEKKRKAEEVKKKAEAEKKRKAEEAKKKAEAEKKRKAAEAKKKAEAEKKRKAAEAKKKAEAEKKRKAAEARKKAEAELAAQMEADLAGALETEQRLGTLRGQYQQNLIRHIKRYWDVPTYAVTCKVKVTQVRGGEVTSVVVTSCSQGGDGLSRALEGAVKRASPLPSPPDPALFQRTLRITFESEG